MLTPHTAKTAAIIVNLTLSAGLAAFADDTGFSPSHESALGTPYVHSFRLEPAFLNRDLFLDYSFRSGDEGEEHEVEVELEWAFNERWGLVIELPYAFQRPSGGPQVDGFGDLAISPRLLLIENERFLLAMGVEFEIPTGNEDRGLGGGEFALAPSLSTWWDLGRGWTLNSQFGLERTFESDEAEAFLRASLIYTRGEERCNGAHHDHHHHGTPRLLSVLFEVDGAVGLNGDEAGDTWAEGIIGMSYGLTSAMDLRVGYQFPLTTSSELDSGVIIGSVWHF